MATHRVELTYEDYLAMPDDGRRHEILDGELAVSATPVTLHQRIVGNLYWVLRGHVRPRGLGEVFLAPFPELGTRARRPVARVRRFAS
jgi:Putative restriction endonuclease